MYLILNCQLRKSSCCTYWRMVSRIWKYIRYAALWTEECYCLVKDGKESRQKSATLSSSLLSLIFLFMFPLFFSSVLIIFLHFTSASFFTSLCHHVVTSAFHFFVIFLSLPYPFSFCWQSSLFTHHFSSVPTHSRVCWDWCRTALEVSTVSASRVCCLWNMLFQWFCQLLTL